MKNILYITISSILLFSCGTKQDETKTEEKKVVKKATISTIKIEPQLFAHYFEVQGAIEAEKNVLVVPEVGGLIKTLPVKEGQNIKKGQIIATFDSDVVASNIEELKEQLDVAKYMYEKQQSLFDQGVGTELALKQAEGQYKTLKQTLISVQTQKGKFVLRAPFSGYVEEVFPVVGQVAGPGSPIIRLIDLSKMSVKADISEAYLAKIDNKNIATLVFPALDNQKIENLPIKRIGKFINPTNRTLGIEIEIPHPTLHHVPNLMSIIKIRDYVDSTAIVVPSRVVLRDVNQNPYVFVYKDGKVFEKQVELGLSANDKTEILTGLNTTDIVVDRGCRGVKNGQKVEINNK
jgi:RND family efflux transporter MFP subunit